MGVRGPTSDVSLLAGGPSAEPGLPEPSVDLWTVAGYLL